MNLASTDTHILSEILPQLAVPQLAQNKKIAVAMSGGVDSSVTALLLKEAGFDVVGIYMKNWSDPRDCRGSRDRGDALRVAMHAGIPFKVVDLENEYREKVIDYFYNEYASGKTPNPDIMCNQEIKFKVFLHLIKKLGFDYMATGHYARVVENPQSGQFQLLSAVDQSKDQSYFLYTLSQTQLASSLFPLGNLTKKQVRAVARELAIPVWDKKDSQGICFVGEVRIKEFLARRLKRKQGAIVSLSGQVLGTHDGAYFYTIGQREGLGIGGGIPYFVVSKDMEKNTITVAPLNHDELLYTRSLQATGLHWVSGSAPSYPTKVQARIRHLQAYQNVTILGAKEGVVEVLFECEQRAINSGQSIVFYEGDIVLGGGVIV